MNFFSKSLSFRACTQRREIFVFRSVKRRLRGSLPPPVKTLSVHIV